MNRLVRTTSLKLLDLLVLSLTFWIAVLLRFDGLPSLEFIKRLTFFWPYVICLQYAGLMLFKVPRFSWRYVGLREVVRILGGLAIGTALLLLLRYGVPFLPIKSGYLSYVQMPTGVLLIDLAVAFLGITGVRALRRLWGERHERELHRPERPELCVPTLLVGAGQAGVMVAKELRARADLGVAPVGFLDDDPNKLGTSINGIEVLGRLADLEEVCARLGVRQVLITIATAPGNVVRSISEASERAGVRLKIIPGLSEIVLDKVSVTHIRDVTIEDLLRRAPVALDEALVHAELKGATVLVTGAGGSIGSELCRQICLAGAERLILVEQAENALFEIHRGLLARFPEVALWPCIADVCDARRIEAIFARFEPDHVFHAAAHKHVPMMELNPCEAVKNNVFGTKTVADAARRHRVRRFVMISTDKAVNPTSVMGATKRVAELYVQALSAVSETRFVAVRFGNVLGSAGSVLPLFKAQIAAGGPVTVTHPEMRRYFMTIPEASQLVLQAGAMGEGSEIFVLDMGEPVFVKDLARDLICLSGLMPDRDIQIVFTGLRPGEKLFEELSLASENATRTRHPKIFIGRLDPRPLADVERALDELLPIAFSAEEPTPERMRAALGEIVPEYMPVVPGEAAPASDSPKVEVESMIRAVG
ncbi:MAG: polysaccharide biosynthesis protein [Myxococcales bacterium]|jgi:FlaA1/EpsC-like NDP-sugar epimerase|nr:polysaccharide biosynthesis protein [Myxococcales bacterium]